MAINGTSNNLSARAQLLARNYRGKILRPAEGEPNAKNKWGWLNISESEEKQQGRNHYKDQFGQDYYLPSEDYEMIKANETLLPLNCLDADQDSEKIQQLKIDIKQGVDDYYQGKATIDDIGQQFKEAFAVVWKRNVVETKRTTGQQARDNLKMMEDVYSKFRTEIVLTAVSLNRQEWKEMSAPYENPNTRSFYYNARYYYESEEAIAELDKTVQEIVEAYGLEPMNPKNFDLPTSWHNSFNESWNTLLGVPYQGLEMRDKHMVPPRGTKFFVMTDGLDLIRLDVKMPGVDISLTAPKEMHLMSRAYRLGESLTFFDQYVNRESQAFLGVCQEKCVSYRFPPTSSFQRLPVLFGKISIVHT